MNESEIREHLAELLLTDEDQIGVRNVESFGEVGLMTSNEGLVLTLADGSEFQIQIIQSR